MRKIKLKWMQPQPVLSLTAVFILFMGILWDELPAMGIRTALMVSGILILFCVSLWSLGQRRQQAGFANNICEMADALMEGRTPGNYRPYEDSQVSKVQGKLLQYYDRMLEGRRQSDQDRQTIQELVSDISHQVKTPVANLLMFADILQKHELADEKRAEFLSMMRVQIDKLDFLMQSLVKMSRLETGTFVLHMEQGSLYNTIAQAVNGIWAKAADKNIQIEAECDSSLCVKHDAKWTAEALENILDNAVKYTPEGGNIQILVRPWQFYTRIDIKDTGIGIAKEHYHDVFKRFYRAQEAAAFQGVGLGLYLARGIITRQNGYISVNSEIGKGTVFSVYLLS